MNKYLALRAEFFAIPKNLWIWKLWSLILATLFLFFFFAAGKISGAKNNPVEAFFVGVVIMLFLVFLPYICEKVYSTRTPKEVAFVATYVILTGVGSFILFLEDMAWGTACFASLAIACFVYIFSDSRNKKAFAHNIVSAVVQILYFYAAFYLFHIL